MGRLTRLALAKSDIVKTFAQNRQTVFRRKDIAEIVDKNRDFWRLAHSMNLSAFINFMLDKTKLKKYVFQFSHRKETLYAWGDVSLYKIIQSIKPNSFFSHYTAIFFHDLTEQSPKTIYLNQEQPPKKNKPDHLEQKDIDKAFGSKVRVSNNIAVFQDYKIVLLSGKYTNRTGVDYFTFEDNEKIDITNLERTLIDATIRPVYSGGIYEVLKAYEMASDRVSVNRLAALLKKIDYIYPYHQAIGFYLERSESYTESQISLFRKFEINYDFYLVHNMKEMEYSKKWRLFYPKGF